jgi:hypothetical protein
MGQGSLDVHLKGPTLEGLGPTIVDRMLAEATTELADYTRFEVLTQLDSVLQHPTGFYESQIRDEPLNPWMHSINDSQVIYGPWLEGIGSRNSPVTRFPGYHTFRIVKNRMEQRTKAIMAAWVERTVKLL